MFSLLNKLIKYNLKFYDCTQEDYSQKVINNILYDESKRIVSYYKELLFWNEETEFLKRFYRNEEALQRLPKISEYYQEHSVTFPRFSLEISYKIMEKYIKRRRRLMENENSRLFFKEEKEYDRILPSDLRKERIDYEDKEIIMSLSSLKSTLVLNNEASFVNEVHLYKDFFDFKRERQVKPEKEKGKGKLLMKNKEKLIFNSSIIKQLMNKKYIKGSISKDVNKEERQVKPEKIKEKEENMINNHKSKVYNLLNMNIKQQKSNITSLNIKNNHKKGGILDYNESNLIKNLSSVKSVKSVKSNNNSKLYKNIRLVKEKPMENMGNNGNIGNIVNNNIFKVNLNININQIRSNLNKCLNNNNNNNSKSKILIDNPSFKKMSNNKVKSNFFKEASTPKNKTELQRLDQTYQYKHNKNSNDKPIFNLLQLYNKNMSRNIGNNNSKIVTNTNTNSICSRVFINQTQGNSVIHNKTNSLIKSLKLIIPKAESKISKITYTRGNSEYNLTYNQEIDKYNHNQSKDKDKEKYKNKTDNKYNSLKFKKIKYHK